VRIKVLENVFRILWVSGKILETLGLLSLSNILRDTPLPLLTSKAQLFEAQNTSPSQLNRPLT